MHPTGMLSWAYFQQESANSIMSNQINRRQTLTKLFIYPLRIMFILHNGQIQWRIQGGTVPCPSHNKIQTFINFIGFFKNFKNKNALRWDVYRPLVERIPACIGWGDVCPGGCLPLVPGGCLPLVPRGVSASSSGGGVSASSPGGW